MSVLVVGLSHQSAPLHVLEQAATTADHAGVLARRLVEAKHVHEAVVLATCNRLEVYAVVSAFHGGLSDIAQELQTHTRVPLQELTDHLYAHYGQDAVRHLFRVGAGLDSMAVGESQVLGQLRTTLRRGQDDATVGRTMDPLLQWALRVGKRVHTETDLGLAGPSLVGAGLGLASEQRIGLPTATILVLGAGTMSALAVSTAARAGARDIVVAGRTSERANRLAASVQGRAVNLADRSAFLAELGRADIVMSCAGALGYLITAEDLRAARAAARTDREMDQQLMVDLGLPRDIDPAVGDLQGVRAIDLAALGALLRDTPAGAAAAQAEAIIAAEIAAWQVSLSDASVAPTVAALRELADEVVRAELGRLQARLSDADPSTRAEVEQTVRRVVDKLLHTPTVRVKALTAQGGGFHAQALRDLFDLSVELELDGSVDGALRSVDADLQPLPTLASVLGRQAGKP